MARQKGIIFSRRKLKIFVQKSSWAISRSTLMMEEREIFETVIFISTPTWLIAGENFNTIICRESLKSFRIITVF
jgi:hypothetical protein